MKRPALWRAYFKSCVDGIPVLVKGHHLPFYLQNVRDAAAFSMSAIC